MNYCVTLVLQDLTIPFAFVCFAVKNVCYISSLIT